MQLGLGALAGAVATELQSHRGLRVRSGIAGDWLLDLSDAGAIADRPGSVVIGKAVGSDKLYSFLDGTDLVEFAPVEEQTTPKGEAALSPFVAVNFAVEVDLLGQANAELAGGRYVGAVGGQVDFFRAAHRIAGGIAIARPALSLRSARRGVRLRVPTRVRQPGRGLGQRRSRR